MLWKKGWVLAQNWPSKCTKVQLEVKMEYGCHLYGHLARTNLTRLDTIQNQALRIILSAFKISPIIALEAKSGIMPLDLRRRLLTGRLIYKIAYDHNHPCNQNVTFFNMLVTEMLPLYLQTFNSLFEFNNTSGRKFIDKL